MILFRLTGTLVWNTLYIILYKSFNLMFEIPLRLRQRFCWPMKTGFCWILEYFKRPVSHHHFFQTAVCTPSTFLPSSTVYPLLILSVCRLFHGNPEKLQEIISYIKTRNKTNKGRYKTVCSGHTAKKFDFLYGFAWEFEAVYGLWGMYITYWLSCVSPITNLKGQ